MQEYFDLKHAEEVPPSDMEKPIEETFYLPMHAVYKATSTTTKVRAVFNTSAKSSTGVSLNDTILIGPTIHPPLIDMLLLFRSHFVALTADISKMYRAVELTAADRDLHSFVWRSDLTAPLRDLPYDPSDVWSVGILIRSQHGCETEHSRVCTRIPTISRCCREMLLC